MTLSAGDRLGRYEIVGPLGAGGMGEVYRARDTELEREVAIKVLPEEVAKDEARLARFEREAKLLASLSHQNIATLYGIEEHEGQRFLVMELAQGETLAERIKNGPIPVDDALPIALQIAEGLEAAHEQGIIHRDLKPANVMLSPEGKVKILDFGLAKAWQEEVRDADLTHSPTLAAQMTAAGVLLGTAAYMSPEQARGKPVDKKADVWSFGVLLWEMLTGRPLFAGETVTDVIAAVVTQEPDLVSLSPQTPHSIRRLLSRCLRKDPRTRLPGIGAARLELQDAITGTYPEAEIPSDDIEEITMNERRRRTRERWIWGAVVLALIGMTAVVIWRATEVPEAGPVTHFILDTPEDLTFGSGDIDAPTISPDGRSIVMSARSRDEPQHLWIRTLDEPEIRVLPGTEGAQYPFWSPDGTSIAFFAEGVLKKLDLANGTVQRICAVPHRFSTAGTWNTSGDIVFEFGVYTNTRLYSVKAAGGEAIPFTTDDTSRGETSHWAPQFLPDGSHILFAVISDEEGKAGLHVTAFEDPNQRRQVLSQLAHFVYAEPGYLLFVQDGVLLAQRFDTERLEVKGEPIAIGSGIAESDFVPDWGRFTVSATGVVTWLSAWTEFQLEWIDRTGKTLERLGEPGRYGQVVLSPDETRLAVEIQDMSGRYDLWIMDVARGVASRVTDDPGDERDPVWSPDGQELVFDSISGGGDLMRKQLSAGEPASTLLRDSGRYIPEFWTRDGKSLLFVTAGEERILSALSLDGDESVEPLTESRPDFDEPQVSPDGRWLASVSTESGQWEVYLEPFRRRGEKVRVSTDGGGQPKWRGDGKELFYLTLGGALAAVDVGEGVKGPKVGAPITLISADVLRAVVLGQDTDDYAVSADGQRFLVKRPATLDGKRQIHVLLNWPSLLEESGTD